MPRPAASAGAGDAGHFDNLNGGLGSLAEVESLSPVAASPYTLAAGLGVNGAAGVKSGGVVAQWPQILGGYGGPAAIDSSGGNWYVNDQAGVAIYRCSQASDCQPADFGESPVVGDADVGGDGAAMPVPAQFAVDPVDNAQLLVATCRVWRGPASGGWSAANAISPILDSTAAAGPCQGNALVRSVAAAQISPTAEVVYLGMYGEASGNASLPGHVLSATVDLGSGAMPAWSDLMAGQVLNDGAGLNSYGFDISSVVIDPHDATGKTVYATVAGIVGPGESLQTVYRSNNGGVSWTAITSNLPNAPANAVAIDPQNANTVYVATDAGVFYTTEVGACSQPGSNCWSAFGSGLPAAPVVGLSATAATATTPALVAATYGRGIWQTPLWSAGTDLSAVSVSPAWLDFPAQIYGTASATQTVALINTGAKALTPTSIAFMGDEEDFSASHDCMNISIAAGASCAIKVTFTPQDAGARTAAMIVYANVYGGQIAVDLNGEGLPGGNVTPSPALAFGQVKVNTTSAALSAWITNAGSGPVTVAGVSFSGPFKSVSNSDTCSGTTLKSSSSCNVMVEFTPTQSGAATGLATFTDSAGAQTVALSGTGAAAPTDTLSAKSLVFPDTPSGQVSAAQTVTIANSGDLALHITRIAASDNFQQSSNCQNGVAAQTHCDIGVQFAPTQAGNLAGTLTIVDELGTQTVALSGKALQPGAIGVSPASLSFPNQQPGVASAPQTVAITNTGGAVLAGIGFQITGPASASYTWQNQTCGAQLASGARCSVQVVFTPSGTGPIAATLAISTSTPGIAAASVPLNGSGQLSSGLTASPAQLAFATAISVGQSSAAQTVTITNSGSYGAGAVTVTAAGPFTLAQNTCAGGLAAGLSCAVAVVFTPTAAGVATGTLMATSAVVASPLTVPLSGTGFDFTAQVSGPASQTATSGQQADYKLVITPNGAAGSFTFQCGTLPANALCLFNPANESLNAGVQGNVEVEIYTGSSGATARMQAPAAGRVWPLAFAVLLLPLVLVRRRRLLLMTLLAALLGAGVSSCASSAGGSSGSGGSGGQGGASRTPAGTYTIPVTVTSTGVSHSVTLTLTVD